MCLEPLLLGLEELLLGFQVSLLRADIPIIENLRNFGAVEGTRFRIIALPLRIRGGDGGQTRVIAEPL